MFLEKSKNRNKLNKKLKMSEYCYEQIHNISILVLENLKSQENFNKFKMSEYCF